MKKNLIFALIAIVIGVAAFYSGLRYGSAQGASSLTQGRGGNFTFRNGTSSGSGGQNGFFSGQITSKDSQSLTLNLRDGSSKIVLFSNSTAVLKSTSGTLNDVTRGSEVIIAGTPNSDGSLTAQSIQIRPGTPNQTPGQ